MKWTKSTSIKIGDGELTAAQAKVEERGIIEEILNAGRNEFVRTTQVLDKVALKKDLEFVERVSGLSVVKGESFSIVT